MSNLLKLETFDNAESPANHTLMEQRDVEDVKLAAFETGYTAGWDDAITAQNAEIGRMHADLGRNLQALSFTYNEARNHILQAIEPLLRDMVAKVLPSIAKVTLPRVVAEQLQPLADDLAQAPITILANPSSLPQIRELLSTNNGLPFVFRKEESLSEGQVYLRMSASETRVDLDAVIAAINVAIETFFRHEIRGSDNG